MQGAADLQGLGHQEVEILGEDLLDDLQSRVQVLGVQMHFPEKAEAFLAVGFENLVGSYRTIQAGVRQNLEVERHQEEARQNPGARQAVHRSLEEEVHLFH